MATSVATPLTSPHGCVGCLQKSQSIADLERRISNLYWIRNEEQLLDSVVTLGQVGAGPSVNSAESDTTIPLTDVGPPASVCAASTSGSQRVSVPGGAPASSVLAAPAPSPHLQPEDRWLLQGAKPKFVPAAALDFTPNPKYKARSSTPLHESWFVASGKKACRTSQQPSWDLQLSNQYDALNLDDFPPLTGESQPGAVSERALPAGVSSSAAPAGVSTLPASAVASIPAAADRPEPERGASRPAASSARRRSSKVRGHSLGSSSRHAVAKPQHPENTRSPSERSDPQPAPPRPLFPPTTLIVGDSIIRHVRFFNTITHCFPGATVPVILNKLPELLRSLPPTVTRIIVHVGCNDTARKQSVLTTADFKDLFSFLHTTGLAVFVSGPIPTLARGAERFSRILSLHTWLLSACRDFDLGFIDNFNLFWNRYSFYKPDGVHPNQLGSRMLAANFQHAVQTATRD